MRYKAYIFDQDGTIYLGDKPLPGAVEAIAAIREAGAAIRFVSNNPTKDPEEYVAKLAKIGIDAELQDITNTVVTTVNWLKHNHPSAVLFPIAEPPLIRALEAAGFEISDDPERIDIVIASYDRTFDYRKLQIAFDALWRYKRAILVQTNPDKYCPFPGGRGEPDCAAIVAAIEACTGVKCQVNFGKPSAIMVEAALYGLDLDPSEVLMVGDRLMTDIAMGVKAGIDTALVLTGDSKLSEVDELPEAERPTHILKDLTELP